MKDTCSRQRSSNYKASVAKLGKKKKAKCQVRELGWETWGVNQGLNIGF